MFRLSQFMQEIVACEKEGIRPLPPKRNPEFDPPLQPAV